MALAATDRVATAAVMLTGAAGYVLLMLWQPYPDAAPYFGTRIYDHYFLAVIDGRLDIPARIANLEGHYDADGRAFIYHGLGPLLFRGLFWPFVDIIEFPVNRVAIVACAIAGTAFYHLALVRAVCSARDAVPLGATLALTLGAMVWVASPGPLLVTNESLFHEPVAFAYMAVGWFVLTMTGVIQHDRTPSASVVPLSLAAALVLYSRPHLAIGLFAACGIVMLLALRADATRSLGRITSAGAILLGAGLGILLVNQLRADSILMMHGNFGAAALEYGGTFWGQETLDSERVSAFQEHGRFNPGRILPNFLMYAFAAAPYGDWIEGIWRELTVPFGYGRLEGPSIGFGFLWAPWIALILMGRVLPARGARHAWILLLATGTGALLMLSYPTVALRYRVDVWPFIAALAILVAPRLADKNEVMSLWRPGVMATLFAAMTLSLFALASTLAFNKGVLRELGLFSTWSQATCEQLVRAKGLATDRTDRICMLPPAPGQGG